MFRLIYLLIVTVAIIVGNVLVIVAVGKFKKLRKTTNVVLASLAVADLLVGTVTVPLYITWTMHPDLFNHSPFMCRMALLSSLLVVAASQLNLLLLSIERYLAVCLPFKHRTLLIGCPSLHVIVIGVTWVISLVSTGLAFFAIKTDTLVCNYYNSFDRWFLFFAVIFGILIPFIAIIFMNIKVFHSVAKLDAARVIFRGSESESGRQVSDSSDREIRIPLFKTNIKKTKTERMSTMVKNTNGCPLFRINSSSNNKNIIDIIEDDVDGNDDVFLNKPDNSDEESFELSLPNCSSKNSVSSMNEIVEQEGLHKIDLSRYNSVSKAKDIKQSKEEERVRTGKRSGKCHETKICEPAKRKTGVAVFGDAMHLNIKNMHRHSPTEFVYGINSHEQADIESCDKSQIIDGCSFFADDFSIPSDEYIICFLDSNRVPKILKPAKYNNLKPSHRQYIQHIESIATSSVLRKYRNKFKYNDVELSPSPTEMNSYTSKVIREFMSSLCVDLNKQEYPYPDKRFDKFATVPKNFDQDNCRRIDLSISTPDMLCSDRHQEFHNTNTNNQAITLPDEDKELVDNDSQPLGKLSEPNIFLFNNLEKRKWFSERSLFANGKLEPSSTLLSKLHSTVLDTDEIVVRNNISVVDEHWKSMSQAKMNSSNEGNFVSLSFSPGLLAGNKEKRFLSSLHKNSISSSSSIINHYKNVQTTHSNSRSFKSESKLDSLLVDCGGECSCFEEGHDRHAFPCRQKTIENCNSALQLNSNSHDQQQDEKEYKQSKKEIMSKLLKLQPVYQTDQQQDHHHQQKRPQQYAYKKNRESWFREEQSPISNTASTISTSVTISDFTNIDDNNTQKNSPQIQQRKLPHIKPNDLASTPQDQLKSKAESIETSQKPNCNSSPLPTSNYISTNKKMSMTFNRHNQYDFRPIRVSVSRGNASQVPSVYISKKVAKTVAMVCFSFIVAWMPFFSVIIINTFCSDCHLVYFLNVVLMITFAQSATNPIIYALYHASFRTAYKNLFKNIYFKCMGDKN